MKRRKREVYLAPSSGDKVYLCIDTTVDGELLPSREYRPSLLSLARLEKLLKEVKPDRIDFNSNGPALTYRFLGKVTK